ncbi:glomulin-like [Limulus polyphemus]|uniref:Glomulin-like n=1 Tax=Limulus polyphemus TaxID=6850 RepID=A0ABM1B9F5_LIMPO|nr:glomulin-like [Limulus polyphemus]
MANNNIASVEHLKQCVKQNDLCEAVKFLSDDKHLNFYAEKSLDVIPVIFNYLDKENDKSSFSFINTCENAMVEIAKRGNAKELLIGFLEQADRFKEDVCFRALIKPLQIVLQRLPGKRGKSLEWTLNILGAHLESLPLPKDYNLEGEERKLLDLDLCVQRIITQISLYLPFFEPFVEEVSLAAEKLQHISYLDRAIHQRRIITLFLVKLLHHPLGYLDLSHTERKAKSSSRVCAEEIIAYISRLQGNFLNVYHSLREQQKSKLLDSYDEQNNSLREAEVEMTVSEIALGVFGYMIFGEEVNTKNIPSLYTHLYLLEENVNIICVLLENPKEMIYYKGLILAQVLLDKLKVAELSSKNLDLNDYFRMSKALIKVMVYCCVEEYRQLARVVFENYLKKLDFEGNYKMLFSLINSEKHAGVQGYLIGLFKMRVLLSLEEKRKSSPFLGVGLKKFLKVITVLPKKVETDLLDHSDCVVASLNLLRFLFLRDKKINNLTGTWSYLNEVQTEFLQPLRTALQLSQAHYKLKLEQIGEKQKKTSVSKTVYVEGQPLPNLPANDKDILKSALLQFDLIESLLVRLEEICDL